MPTIPRLFTHSHEETNIVRTCTKVRIKRLEDEYGNGHYILERRNWLGIWYRPSIDGQKDFVFATKDDVLKWFYWYKSGKKGLLCKKEDSAA